MLETLNIGLRFLIELIGLILYGYWGFRIGNTSIQKGLLSILIPLVIACIWGVFGSPNANISLSTTTHFILEMFIFLLPVVLLMNVNKIGLAYVFGGIFIINKILLLYYES